MSRFLVVVPPFAGHIAPMIGVSHELRARGHEVVWCGDEAVLRRALPPDWPVWGCGAPPPAPRPAGLRGFAAFKHLWESVLVPLADAMLPGVRRAADAVAPDVVIADQQALAGVLAAQQAGLCWATSATTSSALAEPFAAMPRVTEWQSGLLKALAARHGCSGADLEWSPHLVLAFTTAELAPATKAAVRFVGPVASPTVDGGFPWERLDPARAAVLVAFGTANSTVTGPFLREAAAALGTASGIQAVFADPAGHLSTVDVLSFPWLPQQAVLPRMRAVVCHAGHNTVCEALAHGIPLVLAPIRDDQPVIAQQVVDAGAGIRLRFDHARASHIGDAVTRVLTEPSFTEAASRIRDSFAAAGGAPAAADALEELAC